MRFLYLNAGLYLNDLYNLVKRKSKAETFSLMAIPGVFAVLFVSVLAIFAHVPNLTNYYYYESPTVRKDFPFPTNGNSFISKIPVLPDQE